MNFSFKLALWNANGLAQHSQEVQLFLIENKLDILLISETHFTDRSHFKIPNYTLYFTNHPDNTAHGGSAVLIKSSIKHHELPKFQTDYLQATSIVVEDWTGPLTISAVYCPPRHVITHQQFEDYFSDLGGKFIAGGDYNAKHQHWGSRLANPRGRQLYRVLIDNNFDHLSTGEPTYWPTDMRKVPDVLDIFVIKGIPQCYLYVESNLDLSSDHSPVLATISTAVIKRQINKKLYNKHTDWNKYRNHINEHLSLDIPLLAPDDVDAAIDLINESIVSAAAYATPTLGDQQFTQTIQYPTYVKRKIAEKRRLRRVWQNSRNYMDKANFNRAAQNLKRSLYNLKNQWFKDYTESLSASAATDYSLWKATKRIKRPTQPVPPLRKQNGIWAKSDKEKAEAFAEYFCNVFQPHAGVPGAQDEEILEYLDTPLQLSLPIKKFTPAEIKFFISSEINPNKCPGYDSVTGKLLKELPRKAEIFIAFIFNAILRLEYFPSRWKQAQIIVIPKPGKPPNEISSFRPISLLPVLSKVFEKLLLKRLHNLLNENEILPDHQFGFRTAHSTIEQLHRVVEIIRQSLENKQYCSAAFLDVSQAFDKVWYDGLLYKIKKVLPHSCFRLLKSYLTNRRFQIKFQEILTPFNNINSGVPQGSVLGPFLYTLFTADLPVHPGTSIATFADDTAVLAVHDNPLLASQYLQAGLNGISTWLNTWRTRVNVGKSVHATFTLRNETCAPVQMNNTVLPQVTEVKYLGLTIDRRLTWRSHIWLKRQQLNLKCSKLNWLLQKQSHLSLENKLLLYKTILKPIWTYGLQIWGTASKSNIEIIQRFQSKILRKITNAPWYVSNQTLHSDLKIPFVKSEISKISEKYLAKLNFHPNFLAVNLLDNSEFQYRLKRSTILDLPLRFV